MLTSFSNLASKFKCKREADIGSVRQDFDLRHAEMRRASQFAFGLAAVSFSAAYWFDMPSKRKRISEMAPIANDKHVAFEHWSRTQGVEINGVAPVELVSRGVGLMTTKNVKRGERILFIPEKAMFKPSLSTLKADKLDAASPQAQLTISAMIAFRQSDSKFSIWEQTWPTRENFAQSFPIYWPQEAIKLLPPSVNQPLDRQLADYQKDWNVTKDVCQRRGFDEQDFKYYWMIVNSRSFHWKPSHARAGSMVMCPFIDYLNHGPTGSTCLVSQNNKGYEVHADRDYERGEEVLATYGGHSNDKLLVHYGFICSNEPKGPSVDDDIRLDHLIIPRLEANIRDQLQDVGFLGGYSLIPTSNELCFKTQVAIRAATLTCNEWEYFAANGDDLAADHSATVNNFVKALLTDYRSDAVQKLSDVQRLGSQPTMLSSRWKQIIDAIDTFSKS